MDMPAEYYIKYLDGDGDWVTMLTDDDLEAAVCTCASDVLALKILDKTKLETSKYISYTSEVLQLEATTTVGSTYETLSFIRMLKQQQRDQACLHLVRDDSLRLRLYTDPSLFVFSSPGRERSSIQGNNTRTTLKGSSYQIDYYKFYCTQKEYVGKLPVVPPEDAYREVLGANLYRALGVKAAKTTLTKVKVNNPIAAEIIHENPALGYAVMSKKVTPFQVLGTSFVEKLMLPTPRTTPITITTTIPSNPPSASLNLRVEGLWTLTAIAKWIGDMDFLGRSGGNAGFKVVWRQVTTPTSGGVTALPFLLEPVASIKKIDAGYVGGDFTGANNAARVRSKHIAFGVDYQHAILFSSLSPEEKKEFMAGITKIVNMSEREIRELVTSACPFTPQTPADLTSVKSLEDQRAITSLINKQKELQLIYKDELSQAINLPISVTSS
ncbi:hypothetical protein Pelo_5470 [Pelomyxa schiedti]|nr:hypothetical protein Pelo_5470 [Pelomyxa schiedti]